MNPFDVPGCTFISYIRNRNINRGRPIPLFTPAPPDLVSINTMEGWNAIADKQNRRSFRLAHGRDPADDVELRRWVYDVL